MKMHRRPDDITAEQADKIVRKLIALHDAGYGTSTIAVTLMRELRMLKEKPE